MQFGSFIYKLRLQGTTVASFYIHLGVHQRECFVMVKVKGNIYKHRSINKLQNSVILLIRNMCFVGNFILNKCGNFFDDDVIIVTSSVYKHSLHVFYFSH